MNAFSHACGAGQRLITVFLFCFLLPAWAQSAEMVVGEAIQHDTSASLRDMAAVVPEFAGDKVVSIRERAKLGRFPDLAELDGGLQETEASPLGGLVPTPTPLISVEGLSDDDNAAIVGGRIVPPDVNGDIGLDGSGNRIYIQYINLIWAIYNANTGALIEGPFVGNSFWQGFGGYCEFNNDGDPIVLYDDHAGRWFFSQFSINEGIQCVAVSATGDPMGAYHRYAFLLTPNGANDYPKLGVWDDGTAGSSGQSAYTFTLRDFGGAGGSFSVSAGVLERDAILAGQPAKRVKFINPCTGTDCIEGQLPPHMDGAQAPAGTCPTFWTAVDAAYDDSPHASDGYRNHTLSVDWTTTSNSTYTEGPLVPAGAKFDRFLGNGFCDCISPVEGGGEDLDCLAAFTMYRAQYRWLGSQASVVLNTTVDAGGDRAGIRWAEVRSADGDSGWFRQQDGTYAPGDGRDRWMGSIAQDRDGNIALGYAVTGPGLLPSVAYTSRTAGDTAGTLPGGEVICHEGTGVQVGSSNRWGDYSSMSIDPTDDCTFWYTQEYYETTGSFDFNTRICSFKFANCGELEACATDADCDDGLFCNGAESCNDGVCQAGLPPADDDGVGCTASVCNEATDSIEHVADDSLCDNGRFCDGAEICDPVSDCQAGAPPVLEDGVGCTVDTCDETNDIVVHNPDDALCSDGFFCNGEEICSPVDGCGPGPACVDACDEVADVCIGCGDGICGAGEDCSSCPEDCISGSLPGALCGNGLCEAGDGENGANCPADCAGKLSGKPSGRFSCGFNDGYGPDGCGDPRCTSGGFACLEAPLPAGDFCCGDALCEGEEDPFSCGLDCGSEPFCGNDTIEFGEICDGIDLGGLSCTDLGFDGGTLACQGSCQDFDTSDCFSAACAPTDSKEKGPRCTDGLDNDCDGDIDFADTDCR